MEPGRIVDTTAGPALCVKVCLVGAPQGGTMLNELYHSLDPVAFSAGPITIYWYGLAYMVGALLAGFAMYRTQKRWNIGFTPDDVMTVVIAVVFGLLIGGRLGYVLFYSNGYYFTHPLEIFFGTNGGGISGMSFHGGLAGGLLGGFIACRYLRISPLTVADASFVGVPLALCLGRCANFVNGELWGKPTDLPWGVVFGGAAGNVPRHPSQLYEALLEGVVLFAILYVLSRRAKPLSQGSYLGIFVLGYGIVRFLIEFVRLPDAQLGYLAGGWLTMGQLLSLPLIAVGAALLVYAWKTRRPQHRDWL